MIGSSFCDDSIMEESNTADVDVYDALAMLVRALIAPIGDMMMVGRRESVYGPKERGGNSELDCMAMAMAVINRFCGMVEWDIEKVGRQWPWLCR